MFSVKVTERHVEAEDVVVFRLGATSSESLPKWRPGAHIDVEVPLPDGTKLLRQYSLCGHPDDADWRIAVLNAPASRGGSSCMYAAVQVGQILRVSEPKDSFPLHEDDSPAVLFAGGIGITPLVPMAYALHERGASFLLHYQCRSRNAAALLRELQTSRFAERVSFATDEEIAPSVAIAEVLSNQSPNAHVYSCGPAGFIIEVERLAAARGFRSQHMHHELFTADPLLPNMTEGRGFELVLADSGLTIFVPPDKSAAEALEEAGVYLPLSCEQGMCGSCLTQVLEGEPEHRDSFLSSEERGRSDCFTPCCSRARTDRLVIRL